MILGKMERFGRRQLSPNGSGVWLEREERARNAIHLTALAIHRVRQRAASFNNNFSNMDYTKKEIIDFAEMYHKRAMEVGSNCKGADWFFDDFMKSIISKRSDETRAVRQNEHQEKDCIDCKYSYWPLDTEPCNTCESFSNFDAI